MKTRAAANLTFDWPDIEAVATMTMGEGDAHVEFACYEIFGYGQDAAGEFTVKLFPLRGGNCEDTQDLALAQPLFRGFIKFDACSHVYFGEGDNRGYIHMCGKESWERLPRALERIFAEAGKLLKSGYNDEFFE